MSDPVPMARQRTAVRCKRHHAQYLAVALLSPAKSSQVQLRYVHITCKTSDYSDGVLLP